MMDTSIKVGIGFLAGSLMGVAVGLLMAPTTGKQARKKLGKKSRKLAKKMAAYVGMEDKIHLTPSRRKDGRAQVHA